MRKSIILLVITIAIVTGCGEKYNDNQELQAQADVTTVSPKDTQKVETTNEVPKTEAPIESPQVEAAVDQPEEVIKADEQGHMSIDEYAGLIIGINSFGYKDGMLTFDFLVRNDSQQEVSVSSFNFYLVTNDKEKITQTFESMDNGSTLLSGGVKKSFVVQFDVDVEDVQSIVMQNVLQDDIYMIPQLPVERFYGGVRNGKAPPKPGEGDVPLGGGTKADSYEE